VYTEGWERQQKLVGAEAKTLKTQINTLWIYLPVADRAAVLAAADPAIPVARADHSIRQGRAGRLCSSDNSEPRFGLE
jgi:hypothetical protein